MKKLILILLVLFSIEIYCQTDTLIVTFSNATLTLNSTSKDTSNLGESYLSLYNGFDTLKTKIAVVYYEYKDLVFITYSNSQDTEIYYYGDLKLENRTAITNIINSFK